MPSALVQSPVCLFTNCIELVYFLKGLILVFALTLFPPPSKHFKYVRTDGTVFKHSCRVFPHRQDPRILVNQLGDPAEPSVGFLTAVFQPTRAKMITVWAVSGAHHVFCFGFFLSLTERPSWSHSTGFSNASPQESSFQQLSVNSVRPHWAQPLTISQPPGLTLFTSPLQIASPVLLGLELETSHIPKAATISVFTLEDILISTQVF